MHPITKIPKNKRWSGLFDVEATVWRTQKFGASLPEFRLKLHHYGRRDRFGGKTKVYFALLNACFDYYLVQF